MGRLSLEAWLARLGAALRELKLHETETHSRTLTNRRFIISIDEIQRISKSCPNLEDLTIDLAQSGDGKSERAFFALLARLPKLAQIGLRFDLGIVNALVASRTIRNGEDKSIMDNSIDTNPFSPKNPSWIENVWSVIRHKKKFRRIAPLKELQVKVGEWDKWKVKTYPDEWHGWHQKHCCEILARPNERDDRPDEIMVQKTAPSTSGPRGEDFEEKEVLRNGRTRLSNGERVSTGRTR